MMAHNLNSPSAIGSLVIMSDVGEDEFFDIPCCTALQLGHISAFAEILEPHRKQKLVSLIISVGSWTFSVFPAMFHLQRETTIVLRLYHYSEKLHSLKSKKSRESQRKNGLGNS